MQYIFILLLLFFVTPASFRSAHAQQGVAPVAAPPAASQPLSREETERLLEAFWKSQTPSFALKSDVNQGLTALRTELSQQILDAERLATGRQKDVFAKIQDQANFEADQRQKLRSDLELKPFWQSGLGVALISALISALVSLSVAELNNWKARLQRRKDHANDLALRWEDKQELVSNAFWVLEHPQELQNGDQRNRVIWLGDFYNHIALMWSNGAADANDLEHHEFRQLFMNFWVALENAERQGGNVKTLMNGWKPLWEICGRPTI